MSNKSDLVKAFFCAAIGVAAAGTVIYRMEKERSERQAVEHKLEWDLISSPDLDHAMRDSVSDCVAQFGFVARYQDTKTEWNMLGQAYARDVFTVETIDGEGFRVTAARGQRAPAAHKVAVLKRIY